MLASPRLASPRLASPRLASPRLARVLTGLTGAAVLAAISCSSDSSSNEVSCGTSQNGRTYTSATGARLEVSVTPGVSPSVTEEWSYRGQLFLRTTTQTSNGSHVTDVVYGAAFHGVHHAVITTADGETFSGSIDGRTFLPFRKGDAYTSMRFTDGQPFPEISVDPAAQHAIETLRSSSASCAGQPPTPVSGSAGELVMGYQNPGHTSDAAGTSLCFACQDACIDGFGICAFGVATGCTAAGPFYGICVAIGLGVCGLIAIACEVTCNFTACCPVACGSGCCLNGESCLDPSAHLCCDQGTTGCHAGNGTNEENCCKPGDVCILDGSCCQGDHTCRGNELCCAPDELCGTDSTGTQTCLLCPAQQQCFGTCCPSGESCIQSSGNCCPITSARCGGHCCPGPSYSCTGASGSDCCSDSVACGTLCCGTGQVCLDATTNTCGVCPANEAICHPPSGLDVCCAPGRVCDSQGCCAGNQLLCGNPPVCTDADLFTGGCP